MMTQVSSGDVQSLLNLLTFVTDPECKKNLEALAKLKAENDAILKQLEAQRAELEQATLKLGIGEAGLAERTQELDKRETEFEQRQRAFQGNINDEHDRLTNWHAAQNKSHAEKAAELNNLQNGLDGQSRMLEQREKALVKRESAALQKDEQLTLRERQLSEDRIVFEKRRKRIAEAAAESGI